MNPYIDVFDKYSSKEEDNHHSESSEVDRTIQNELTNGLSEEQKEEISVEFCYACEEQDPQSFTDTPDELEERFERTEKIMQLVTHFPDMLTDPTYVTYPNGQKVKPLIFALEQDNYAILKAFRALFDQKMVDIQKCVKLLMNSKFDHLFTFITWIAPENREPSYEALLDLKHFFSADNFSLVDAINHHMRFIHIKDSSQKVDNQNDDFTKDQENFENSIIAIIKLMIRYDCDLNTPGQKGNTLLHWAAFYGNLKITEILLNNGADVTKLNSANQTPLDIAQLHASESLNLTNTSFEAVISLIQNVDQLRVAP